MKVDLMRKVDFWLGLPLAAMATGLHRLLRALIPERAMTVTSVRRILWIELSEMGSTILVDPAMRRASSVYPQAESWFLIFAENQASLRILETIPPQRTLLIRSGKLRWLLLDTLKMIWRLRCLRFDLVFDLELFSRYTSLLTLLSAAPWRVGFHRYHNEGLYRGDHLTHPVAYNPHQHIAKNFLALLYAPTQDPAERPYTKQMFSDADIRLSPYVASVAAQAALRQRLLAHAPLLAQARHWLILNPNASEMLPLRKWPLDAYAALATGLLALPDLAILITGASSEKTDAQRLIAAVGDARLIDLTGFTKLEDLPILYTLCTAMVTNDSGPAHFAAPTGIRTFVFFGPETPHLYGAINPNASFFYKGLACSPCVSAANHRKTACNNNLCLQQITVAEVLQAVLPCVSEDVLGRL